MRMNDLLDVLNSSNDLDPCLNKRALSAHTAEHHLQLLPEADQWLGRWTVADGVTVYSIAGLQQTIRGVAVVWEQCQEAGIDYLCTRRLTQDPLENFFCVIRQGGGDRDNPDPTQFKHSYKHAALNSLLFSSCSANCEADKDSLLATMSPFAFENAKSGLCTRTPRQVNSRPKVISDVVIDGAVRNVLVYIAGYLVHSVGTACSVCTSVLLKDTHFAVTSAECLTAFKSYTGRSTEDVGSLRLPSDLFAEFIRSCYVTFHVHALSILFEERICQRLVSCMLDSLSARYLLGRLCHPKVLETMTGTYVRMELHALSRMEMDRNACRSPGVKKRRKLLKLQHC